MQEQASSLSLDPDRCFVWSTASCYTRINCYSKDDSAVRLAREAFNQLQDPISIFQKA